MCLARHGLRVPWRRHWAFQNPLRPPRRVISVLRTVLLDLASFEIPKKENNFTGGDGRGRASPGTTNLGFRSAGDHQVPPAGLTLLLPCILGRACARARQVKEELGKFQGEVCGQLQDTALCIRQAVARLCCVLAETAAKPQRRL